MSSPNLADLQRQFKTRIRAGSGPALPLIGSEERLAVYTGGYLARYEQALAEVYEALRHIVGREQFHQLSHAYAQRHPSHDYNLSFVGRELPNFLTTYSLSSDLPFLPDLARLEWQVCQAFHAFEQPPMDPSTLASLPLEEREKTRLVFQPSVSVVSSAWPHPLSGAAESSTAHASVSQPRANRQGVGWPILDLWAARTTPRENINIDLVNRPQHVLVFRQNLQVRCELLEPLQQPLLAALLGGATLGSACEAIAVEAGHALPPIGEWFAHWARQGLILRCETVENFRK